MYTIIHSTQQFQPLFRGYAQVYACLLVRKLSSICKRPAGIEFPLSLGALNLKVGAKQITVVARLSPLAARIVVLFFDADGPMRTNFVHGVVLLADLGLEEMGGLTVAAALEDLPSSVPAFVLVATRKLQTTVGEVAGQPYCKI